MQPTIHRTIDRARAGDMLYMSCSNVDQPDRKDGSAGKDDEATIQITVKVSKQEEKEGVALEGAARRREVSRSGRGRGRSRIMLSRCDLSCATNYTLLVSIHQRYQGD